MINRKTDKTQVKNRRRSRHEHTLATNDLTSGARHLNLGDVTRELRNCLFLWCLSSRIGAWADVWGTGSGLGGGYLYERDSPSWGEKKSEMIISSSSSSLFRAVERNQGLENCPTVSELQLSALQKVVIHGGFAVSGIPQYPILSLLIWTPTFMLSFHAREAHARSLLSLLFDAWFNRRN